MNLFEIDKNRLTAFTDAILAILMTILVLEFRVPRLEDPSVHELKEALRHLLPALLSYAVSFLTVICIWFDHHLLLKHVREVDKKFTLLNFFFILCISPLPFTTAFAGEYIDHSFAVMVLGFNFLLMNISFAFLFWYAHIKKTMPAALIEHKYSKSAGIISMIGMLITAIGIPVALINTYLAFALFLSVAVLHMLKKQKM